MGNVYILPLAIIVKKRISKFINFKILYIYTLETFYDDIN